MTGLHWQEKESRDELVIAECLSWKDVRSAKLQWWVFGFFGVVGGSFVCMFFCLVGCFRFGLVFI